MQLLYIFLEKYLNFEKQGFCFTSEFDISFKEIDNQVIFNIEENRNHIDNFFENKSILDVTAIIGENGTGKSNLLNFIYLALADGNGGFSVKSFLVFKDLDTEQVFVRHTFKQSEIDWKANIPNLEYRQSHPYVANKNQYAIEESAFVDFIYYTNNFDLKFSSSEINTLLTGSFQALDTMGFYNISTQAMIAHDRNTRGQNIEEKNLQDIGVFKYYELARNLDFVLSELSSEGNHIKQIGFTIPNVLMIQIDNTLESFFQTNSKNDIINELFNEANFNPTQNKNVDLTKKEFIKSLTYAILAYHGDSQYKLQKLINKQEDLDYDNFDDPVGWFKNFLIIIKRNIQLPMLNGRERLESNVILEFVDFFIENTEPGPFQTEGNVNGRTLAVPIGEYAIDQIKTLYRLQSKLPKELRVLFFGWRSLSSGEQSLLTLYSRFFYLKEKFEFKVNENRDTKIILVDEGDLYFHPEWQRKYLNTFINAIPQILGRQYKYQFILTANTPFLAADLPSDKVIRLKKEREDDLIEGVPQYRTKVQKADETKTFAANIHTLLSDGFFLTSFLGEFAQKKIEKIAKTLHSEKEIDPDNKHRLKNTINVIGEEIIRNRLITLYEEKFQEPFYERNIEDEIAELENRLKRLKGHQKGGDDDQN